MTGNRIGWYALLGLAVMSASAAANSLLAESTAGMVVSAQHLASDVGAAVLRDGGNAIDAAVATGYALAVTHPCCGNVGGGGFMVIHLANGTNVFLNFRETAPHAATARMYLDANGNPIPDKSIDGYLAVGVPGTVMGLETAREKYGSMSRERLMAPAIELAARGFTLMRGDVHVLEESAEAFRREPNVAAIFLNHGTSFKPGERLIQPRYAPSAPGAPMRSITARLPPPSPPPAGCMAAL
jgi:gamma-glutamyltranspeptidase/glutathione hydrolase